MEIPDYDKALYYILWGQWDNLLILMVRTKDDILSKRIQHFLHAYHYATDQQIIVETHDNLLCYLDHAMKYTTPTATIEMQ
ncbi:MAG TPA: YhdB family protein [Cerasibacillus sp.]|uniref:YhdB family protein n=1 Tax=Cerasibacillus sp. TaxID=2498711 RepID=UPI002F40CFE4